MTLRDRQVFDHPGYEEEAPPPPVQRRLPTPWIAGAVVAICGAVWLLDVFVVHHLLGEAGALYGPLVAHGQWWRIFTDVFVHAEPDLLPAVQRSPVSAGLTEGLLHIGFNMWVVVTLGFAVERSIGSWRMLLISLVTALGASAFSLYFNYGILTIGASGMILGWAGALLPIVTREGRRQIGLWLVQIAVISLLPGVSWAGHLGGLLFGLPCGFALRKGQKFWAAAGVLIAVGLLANWLAVQAHVPHLG